MDDFDKLRTNFKCSQDAFNYGLKKLTMDFQERQEKETGRVSLDDGFLNQQPSDFGLFYCLTETMAQLDRCMKEKPSRELSLVETKLQEALFWASQV